MFIFALCLSGRAELIIVFVSWRHVFTDMPNNHIIFDGNGLAISQTVKKAEAKMS